MNHCIKLIEINARDILLPLADQNYHLCLLNKTIINTLQFALKEDRHLTLPMTMAIKI
jgi:hypothetical protein